MQALLEIGVSNAVVASVLAVLAVLARLLIRRPAFEHALCVLFFLKLIVPPLAEVPLVTWAHSAPDDRLPDSEAVKKLGQAPRGDQNTPPNTAVGSEPVPFLNSHSAKTSHRDVEATTIATQSRQPSISDRLQGTFPFIPGRWNGLTADYSAPNQALPGLQNFPSQTRSSHVFDLDLDSSPSMPLHRERGLTESVDGEFLAATDPPYTAGLKRRELASDTSNPSKPGSHAEEPFALDFSFRSTMSSYGRAVMLCIFWMWATGTLVYYVLAGRRILLFESLLRHAVLGDAELQCRVTELATRLGLRRPPIVYLLPGAVSPMVWSFGRRPKLLMPRELFEHLDPDQVETLLTHELAHLRRRDHWVRILELIVTGLYWWHPVVWLASRRIRELEEEICDWWVTSSLPEANQTYATALLNTLDFLSDARPAVPFGATGIGQMTFIKKRLTMIMRGTSSKRLSPICGGAVILLAVLSLPWSPRLAHGDGEESTPNEQQAIQRRKRGLRPPIAEEKVERMFSEIGRLLVEGRIDEATELAAEARAIERRLRLNRLSREDHETEEHLDVRTGDEQHAHSVHQHAQDAHHELATELHEAVHELHEQLNEAADEIREEIAEAIAESSDEVTHALKELGVERVLDEALQNAPDFLEQFLKETEIADAIVSALDEQVGSHSTTEQTGDGISPAEVEKIGRELETEIREELSDAAREIQQAMDDVREEVAETVEDVAEVMRDIDIKQLIEETVDQAPELVRDFLEEVDVDQIVDEAMEQAQGAIEHTRDQLERNLHEDNIERQRRAVQQQLRRARQVQEEARQAATRQANELRGQLDQQRQATEAARQHARAAAVEAEQAALRQLHELEIQQEHLLETFGPDHPRVKFIQKRIDRMHERLGEQDFDQHDNHDHSLGLNRRMARLEEQLQRLLEELKDVKLELEQAKDRD